MNEAAVCESRRLKSPERTCTSWPEVRRERRKCKRKSKRAMSQILATNQLRAKSGDEEEWCEVLMAGEADGVDAGG